MLGHEKALEEMLQLNKLGVHLVLIELMEAGKISFHELAEMYIDKLRRERNKSFEHNARLGLHLGGYCMRDNTPSGKSARQLMYESGAYTGADGSGFGTMLEKEFGTQKQP
jgi:hypothetical protein